MNKIKNITTLRAELDRAIAARDRRMVELRAEGLSYAEIAAHIEAEGYGERVTRAWVQHVVMKAAGSRS